jgi:hypothetical protein
MVWRNRFTGGDLRELRGSGALISYLSGAERFRKRLPYGPRNQLGWALIDTARQLDLFRESDAEGASEGAHSTSAPGRLDLVCWTKMQAEAGQPLSRIVDRKELERKIGRGLFFWGVGTPLGPGVSAAGGRPIKLIFSTMLSPPKLIDSAPSSVLVWRKYYDPRAGLSDLPSHVLVLSRGQTPAGPKLRHYALVCFRRAVLTLRPGRLFDPSVYRNVGGSQRVVGPSQVTSLLKRVEVEEPRGRYKVDMQAKLISPYCVRLEDPAALRVDEVCKINDFRCNDTQEWIRFVSQLRSAQS